MIPTTSPDRPTSAPHPLGNCLCRSSSPSQNSRSARASATLPLLTHSTSSTSIPSVLLEHDLVALAPQQSPNSSDALVLAVEMLPKTPVEVVATDLPEPALHKTTAGKRGAEVCTGEGRELRTQSTHFRKTTITLASHSPRGCKSSGPRKAMAGFAVTIAG